MKLSRKLVPAIAMLLVSLIMMSTASYAWFSMNTKVTATGMEVIAHSDSVYLEIASGDSASVSESDFGPSATANTQKGTLNLAVPTIVESESNIQIIETEPFDGSSPAGKKYYKATVPDGHLICMGDIKDATDLTKYYTVSVKEKAHEKAGKTVDIPHGGKVTYYQKTGTIAEKSLVYTETVVTNSKPAEEKLQHEVPEDALTITFIQGVGTYKKDEQGNSDGVNYFSKGDTQQASEPSVSTTDTTKYTMADKSKFTEKTYKPEMSGQYVFDKTSKPINDVTSVTLGDTNKCYVKAPHGDNFYKLSDVAENSSLVGRVAWFTGSSTDADEHQGTNAVEPVATADLDSYRLSNTFTMTVGGKAAQHLKVSRTSVDTANLVNDDIHDAIRILIVATKTSASGDKEIKTISYNAGTKEWTADSNLFDKVGVKDVIEAEVYIFFDGTDTTTFTNNITMEFLEYAVELDFAIDEPSA